MNNFYFSIRLFFYLALRDPVFVFGTIARMLKSPFALARLLRGDTKRLPRNFYLIVEEVLSRYSALEFKKFYSHIDCLDYHTLRTILEKTEGPQGFLQHMLKLEIAHYLICRIKRPSIVVETGVYWGFSSAHILEALAANNKGALFSVDLPDPSLALIGVKPGLVVPERLKGRWKLFLGKSCEVLPTLLQRLKEIDIFIHDSEHTYDNMMFEYTTAWEYIRRGGGLLISDDVDPNGCAFIDFCRSVGARYLIKGTIGVAMKENNL